jgi:hypothetical protein
MTENRCYYWASMPTDALLRIYDQTPSTLIRETVATELALRAGNPPTTDLTNNDLVNQFRAQTEKHHDEKTRKQLRAYNITRDTRAPIDKPKPHPARRWQHACSSCGFRIYANTRNTTTDTICWLCAEKQQSQHDKAREQRYANQAWRKSPGLSP